MLGWRLISAAVIIAIVLALVLLDYFPATNFGRPGIWLVPMGLPFALLGAAEMLDLLRTKQHRPVAWTVYAGTLIVVLAACVPVLRERPEVVRPFDTLGWPAAGFCVALAIALAGEMSRFKKPTGAIVNAALAIFTVAYVGLLISVLGLLRLVAKDNWGMAALLSVIIIVKISDSGAYFAGRLFGRRKLTPLLSPGKTVEGAVGGIVAGLLASLLVFQFIVPTLIVPDSQPLPVWRSLLYGLIVTFAAMHGDLAESLVKRDMERKDSSRWLPGLGGVLDILDSLLIAGPAAYLCWAFGLVGPVS